MVPMDSKAEILLDGLAFPEGPRWHEGRLWFSDMHGEAVHTVDPAAEVKVDLASGQVQVQSGGDHAAIARAIEEEGYKVAA